MNLIAFSSHIQTITWIYASPSGYRFFIWNEGYIFFFIKTTLQAVLVAQTLITKPLSYLTFNFPRDIFFSWYQNLFFYITPFTLTLFIIKRITWIKLAWLQVQILPTLFKNCVRAWYFWYAKFTPDLVEGCNNKIAWRESGRLKISQSGHTPPKGRRKIMDIVLAPSLTANERLVAV